MVAIALLCYLPLMLVILAVITIVFVLGFYFAFQRRRRPAILVAVPLGLILAPVVTVVILDWSTQAGRTLEFGCFRGGVCCGGAPFNALLMTPNGPVAISGPFGALQGGMA